METTEKKSEIVPTSGRLKNIWMSELLRFALIAVVIVLPIRLFIAQPFIVSGASMEPTFSNNEYLIVDELSYNFKEPARGDVVVFKYPLDRSKFFIKRIIAIPKETIEINDGAISITNADFPKGKKLEENYVSSEISGTIRRTLGENEYYVLGDNRNESSDSRVWGTLERKDIIGRPIVRLFPFNRIKLLPGKHNF